tara:strand:- start:6008 stop:7732 length:1725 start_codon:yes stop_codon:yes gene_type:complete
MSNHPPYRLRPEQGATLELDLPATEALTVAARVHIPVTRTEALQPLVSQWHPQTDFSAFTAYDAGRTDGLSTKGYFGAVGDGRYVYFCPVRDHQDRYSVHGHVLRYDTHGNFKDPDSWAAYDAGHTDGMRTVGFYGGAFDGRYIYFNPRDDGHGHHTRLLRYDTYGDFKDPDSWAAHDAEFPHSGQGLAFDGRHIYFCPGYTTAPDVDRANPSASLDNEPSGQILRYDTQAPLKKAQSYEVFDACQLSPQAACFDGALYDGHHIYFAPLTSGLVLRYTVGSDFSNPTSWQTFDAQPLGMHMNVGLVFDGSHIYFCAYGNSRMLRYDTEKPFDDPTGWQGYEAAGTQGLDTGGFDGGFFDGRYVYYMPFTREPPPGESVFHCNWLRYDTAKEFTDPTAWDAHDASRVDDMHTTAYNAGAFDGRFIYTAPWRGDRDGEHAHGRVLRYDTLGGNGSFSLRFSDFGHNGGLNAAVLGPSFIVNTDQGPISVAAHQSLEAGDHHLVGVYDGQHIQLYVDGTLIAERAANGRPIEQTDVPVNVGHLAGGSARFPGIISEIYLAADACNAEWVSDEYSRKL